MTTPSTPNKGRPAQPWDKDVTRADIEVDQGLGSYHDVSKKLGSEALTVVRTIDIAPQVEEDSRADLFAYYGEGFNPKNGELGAAWHAPTPEEAATQARGLAQVRAELEAAQKRREAS